MAKNTNTPAPVNMNGLPARELKALIDAKKVTAQAVVSFLKGKGKLRPPSEALLAELTGSAPVSAAKPVAPAFDASNILARLGALEVAVASLVERFAAKPVAAKPEPVKPVVKPVAAKPEPVVKPVAAKPVVKPVVAKPVVKPVAPVVAAKPVVKPVAPVAKPVVAAKRQEPPVTQSPVPSEAEMRAALRGCATAQLREEAVASDIEGAETMNKGQLIDALVGLVLAEQQMVASPTPVTPAVDAPKRGKPDLRVVKQAEVEF